MSTLALVLQGRDMTMFYYIYSGMDQVKHIFLAILKEI